MSNKKWTVGDRVAVFIEGPYLYADGQAGRDTFIHAHHRVEAYLHRIPKAQEYVSDSGIAIQAGVLPFDFVGTVIVELTHQELGWRDMWRVVTDEYA